MELFFAECKFGYLCFSAYTQFVLVKIDTKLLSRAEITDHKPMRLRGYGGRTCMNTSNMGLKRHQ